MQPEKYQPVSCDFYDELELLALRQTVAELIIRMEDGASQKLSQKIKNLQTRNKEEFLILENGQEIRLDKLISVNGIELKNYC